MGDAFPIPVSYMVSPSLWPAAIMAFSACLFWTGPAWVHEYFEETTKRSPLGPPVSFLYLQWHLSRAIVNYLVDFAMNCRHRTQIPSIQNQYIIFLLPLNK